MNEERIQAYLNVIQSLLTCASGKESQVLQANVELVDQEFVIVMLAVAEDLAQRGNQAESQWLSRVAEQLAEIVAKQLIDTQSHNHPTDGASE